MTLLGFFEIMGLAGGDRWFLIAGAVSAALSGAPAAWLNDGGHERM